MAFDAPSREWATTVNSPTVNLFLYDLRQSKEHRPTDWSVEKAAGQTREFRPPLMLVVSFAVSAWARAVEDEHRLLSQVLAILNAYPQLPRDVLKGSLLLQPYPVATKVALPRTDGKGDFWSSVGGSYKASLDYTATVAIDSGMAVDRGPEVRTHTVKLRQKDGVPSKVIELHRAGGTVREANGTPVANAWVVLPDAGRWACSSVEGQFQFERLSPGRFECVVRTSDGREARGEFVVPGSGADIKLGGKSARARTAS